MVSQKSVWHQIISLPARCGSNAALNSPFQGFVDAGAPCQHISQVSDGILRVLPRQ